MTEPLAECDQCGADLFDGIPHECPVGGNTVVATQDDMMKEEA